MIAVVIITGVYRHVLLKRNQIRDRCAGGVLYAGMRSYLQSMHICATFYTFKKKLNVLHVISSVAKIQSLKTAA